MTWDACDNKAVLEEQLPDNIIIIPCSNNMLNNDDIKYNYINHFISTAVVTA